uniref:Family with sequence similarity 43 member B n=1 Tax=Gadus morhua TaxID=8049 RepID=A0A8C4Z727_GADMO
MLPWRRSKFVLVEDQAKSKAKSLGGAGLTYHSILSSLLHSCPDLLPDFPLNWVSSLFQTKRQKVELNKEEPVYNARYLGSVVTITAKGSGCTQEAVGKIWTRSNYGEQCLKMRLTVGPQGLRMSPDKRKKPTHVYSLDRITCCAADPCRPKILAWVYRHQVKNMAVVLRCHAVLLSRSEKARRVARSLDRNATAAFGEFKRLKRQSDFRHRQQLLLGEDAVPLMPIRRLLNGQCHYRPPADGPAGSSARLAPIAEEEEEGEGEQGLTTALQRSTATKVVQRLGIDRHPTSGTIFPSACLAQYSWEYDSSLCSNDEQEHTFGRSCNMCVVREVCL